MSKDLVERFTDVSNTSVAHKTALLCLYVSLPGHLVIVAIGYLTIARIDWVHSGRFMLDAWGFVAVSAVGGLVAWLVDRTGKEGTWTYFTFAIPYSVVSVDTIYQFGVQGTPLFAWYPMIIMVVSLWYDARLGVVALVNGLVLWIPLFVVSATDAFPYAPALADRSVDRQQDPLYVAGVALLVITYIVIGSFAAGISSKARALIQRRLDEAHAKLNQSAQLIARYVPAELAEGILAGSPEIADGHHRQKLTIFFSDIVGFSDIAEELEPEDLAMVLNEYFTEMTAIAARHHGTVDELQGDALLIFFGAPVRRSDREHALEAVAMAVEMQQALRRLNERWRSAGITEQIAVRMAINTGVVTVGTFGSTTRMKYAVLGKHVNLAARLQAACPPGKTLLSYSTYLLVQEQVECVPLGALQLKGIHRPVEAFEVAGVRAGQLAEEPA